MMIWIDHPSVSAKLSAARPVLRRLLWRAAPSDHS